MKLNKCILILMWGQTSVRFRTAGSHQNSFSAHHQVSRTLLQFVSYFVFYPSNYTKQYVAIINFILFSFH